MHIARLRATNRWGAGTPVGMRLGSELGEDIGLRLVLGYFWRDCIAGKGLLLFQYKNVRRRDEIQYSYFK